MVEDSHTYGYYSTKTTKSQRFLQVIKKKIAKMKEILHFWRILQEKTKGRPPQEPSFRICSFNQGSVSDTYLLLM